MHTWIYMSDMLCLCERTNMAEECKIFVIAIFHRYGHFVQINTCVQIFKRY